MATEEIFVINVSEENKVPADENVVTEEKVVPEEKSQKKEEDVDKGKKKKTKSGWHISYHCICCFFWCFPCYSAWCFSSKILNKNKKWSALYVCIVILICLVGCFIVGLYFRANMLKGATDEDVKHLYTTPRDDGFDGTPAPVDWTTPLKPLVLPSEECTNKQNFKREYRNRLITQSNNPIPVEVQEVPEDGCYQRVQLNDECPSFKIDFWKHAWKGIKPEVYSGSEIEYRELSYESGTFLDYKPYTDNEDNTVIIIVRKSSPCRRIKCHFRFWCCDAGHNCATLA